MKIGVLTYHYANNYGAVLQAYALKNHLEKQGHNVEILNYNTSKLYLKNRPLKSKIKTFMWNGLKKVLGGAKKEKAFVCFRKSKLEVEGEQIKEHSALEHYVKKQDFDAFIVGSDQVWNTEINGKDKAYFLDFAGDKKRISYAASFGVSDLPIEDLKTVKEAVSLFNAVSVREETGKEILKKSGFKGNIQVVLDPVFFLDEKQWSKIFSKRLIDRKYILCYVMPGDSILENKIVSIANKIKEKTGFEIIFIGRKEYCRFKNDGKDIIGASPEDFLSLIKYAEVVVTNSFHGTAFSILFSKCFYALTNPNKTGNKQLGSRINDLLEILNLKSHLVDIYCEKEYDITVDYTASAPVLEKCIKHSEKFLFDALNG